MASLPSKESAYTQTDDALWSNNGAKQKLVSRLWWSEVPESSHFVQFYETDEFLLDSLGAFVGKGLGSGEACIVIVTKEHREGLEARLQANSLHLDTARARKQYFALDAEETLTQFMKDDKPDPERFAQVVGEVITCAESGQRHVRVFGEMVTLLWLAGKRAAAIQVEALWNDLARTAPPFSLFCAYPMRCFSKEENGAQLLEICQQHAHVIPDESYTLLASPDERLRAITLWQQKAYALEAEIAERKAVE